MDEQNMMNNAEMEMQGADAHKHGKAPIAVALILVVVLAVIAIFLTKQLGKYNDGVVSDVMHNTEIVIPELGDGASSNSTTPAAQAPSTPDVMESDVMESQDAMMEAEVMVEDPVADVSDIEAALEEDLGDLESGLDDLDLEEDF